MRRSVTAFTVALVLAGASTSIAADIDVMSRPHVRVRIYDTVGLDAASRDASLDTAAAILERAGLDVTWIACAATAPAASNPCAAPMRRAELAVRFVRMAGRPQATHVALGYSLVDPRARTGSLATIYVDRVEQLAVGSASSCERLIGRAVAHELGHLLLGTTAHAAKGLMTAVWSREVLTRDRDRDWTFTAADARSMRDAVRSRAVQQLAAHIVWGD